MEIEEIKKKNAYYDKIIERVKNTPEQLKDNKSHFKRYVEIWLNTVEFPAIPNIGDEAENKAASLKDFFELTKANIIQELQTL